MNFIDRLNELIREKGINNKKLLDDLKLGKNSIINWTQRGNVPNGETLKRIADYFNVSIDYLLGKTSMKKSAIETDNGLSENGIKLLNMFKDLSPEAQVKVVELAELLKQRHEK